MKERKPSSTYKISGVLKTASSRNTKVVSKKKRASISKQTKKVSRVKVTKLEKKRRKTQRNELKIKEWQWLKNLVKKIKMLPKNKKRRVAVLLVIVVSILLVSRLLYLFIWKDLPSPNKLSTNPSPVSTLILDRNGKLLFEIFVDQKRTPIRLDQLPEYLKQATIAIEDKDFYKHHGLSFPGITRAMVKNVQYVICQISAIPCPSSFQGGSTITQQLVKNTLLTPKRTIQRKVREAILTLAIEAKYSKNEILEMYLNHVPYGGTAYGIESAAQTYFGKSAKDLSLAEATILVGLPQAPSRYSPYSSNPQAYKNRQSVVLRRMVEDNYLTKEKADKVKDVEIKFAPQANLIHAPHFVLWVKDLLVEKYGHQMVEQGGLRVTTTLDLDLQRFMQKTISKEIADLKSYKVTNGAALITHPRSGQILGMVGSADYFNSKIDGNVNLTLRYRQPGSSIKPLNYVLGFESGNLTPSSLLADIPTCFSVTGQSLYCPVNYDGRYRGAVQARTALANSYNIPAVRVLVKNGLKDMIATASAMGIRGWNDTSKYGLSLTLGGGDVRMVDMAVAYGTLANLGRRIDLNPILKVEVYTGEVLEENNCTPIDLKSIVSEKENKNSRSADNQHINGFCKNVKVISPEAAYLTTSILSDRGARTPTFGNNLNIKNHPEVAVKTGTTNDLRDNWTIGYTPNFLVATWVGNFDNSPMSRIASGVTGAAPIWRKLMTRVLAKDIQNKLEQDELKGEESTNSAKQISVKKYLVQTTDSIWPRPKKIIDLPVCVESGLAVSPDPNYPCTSKMEIFIKDQIPKQHTTLRRPWPIDKTTGQPAFERTPLENIEMQDRLVYFDILGTAICIDCTPPEDPVIIKYPLSE